MPLSRRTFLGTTAAGAMAGAPQQTRRSSIPVQPASVRLDRSELPVIRRVDAVIVGGSLSGVAAALKLAEAGKKVLIVERRTYVGREIGAYLRPWLTSSADLPPLLRAVATQPARGSEIPLHMDEVKLSIEETVLKAGVEVLYQSFPVGLCSAGLVIGNKSGRQVIDAKLILDATETLYVARIAGAQFDAMPANPVLFRRTIEFTGVSAVDTPTLAVPAALGITDNSVTVHRGYRGADHVQVEFGLRFVVRRFDLWDSMRREVEARRKTMALAAHLINSEPAFGSAYLAHTSYELAGPASAPLKSSDGATAVAGVFAIAPALDPVEAVNRGAQIGERLARSWGSSAVSNFNVSAPASGPAVQGIEVVESSGPDLRKQYETARVDPVGVPLARDLDIVVVGGGTSGGTATAVAAREKMRTVVLEMNPGLGGTGTIAGVDSYWFGRQVAFCDRLKKRVKQVQDSIRYAAPPKENPPKWNIEAKMFALLDEADKAGAEVAFGATAIGSIVERGNRVRGVIGVSSYGPFAITSKVVLDCTGDGDVAAFAGAEFVNMSAMDHLGMWYNFAQFTRPGRNSNHFTSSVDIANVEDCTRAILAGRRRGQNCHDHGIYIAARETRHVMGDALVTLTDIMRMRAWPDVVNIHFSNSDMKGKTTSPWFLSGMVPPNFEAEIPYRALVPKGVDNVLIAGKAFSTTHDALAGIRQQPDLENLGGVIAIAGAMAITHGISPRHIDVGELQHRLVKEGLLPETILTRKLEIRHYNEAELVRWVKAMLQDQPLVAYQDVGFEDVQRKRIPFVEVCTAGPKAVPVLEAALATTPRKTLVAQALSIYGARSALPLLIEALDKALAGGSLPVRTANARWAQLPPDQGAMPEPAYLLYSLGMLRDRRALPVWMRIASMFSPTMDDFRDRLRSPFHWVDGVCYGAERLADPAAIPALEKLHDNPLLRGQSTKKGFQPDFVLERLAMLELGLGKALARCGSARGYRILIEYLDDNRNALSLQAHTNLIRIAGRDLGKGKQGWTEWLSGNQFPLVPAALTEDLDILFEQDIYVTV